MAELWHDVFTVVAKIARSGYPAHRACNSKHDKITLFVAGPNPWHGSARRIGGHMPLSKTYDEALVYAADLHRDQVRKGSGIPYVAHLLSVSSRVLCRWGDRGSGRRGAATRRRGGPGRRTHVERNSPFRTGGGADCVRLHGFRVIPKPNWRPRKEAYLASLPGKAKTSLLVSLADKVDNAQAILQDYRSVGDDLWSRVTGEREWTIWYYRALGDIFQKHCRGHFLGRIVPNGVSISWRRRLT